MGIGASWIAVRGREPAEIFDALGLEVNGYSGDPLDHTFSFAALPGGWTLIVSSNMDWAVPERVSQASAGGVAVGCQMEEHVMYSAASGHEDGALKWSLLHNLDQDKMLDVEGEPPAPFAAIRDRMFQLEKEKGDADYVFDIPIALTASICGYRPDEDVPGLDADAGFQYLDKVRMPDGPRGPGPFAWLGRFFSRPT